MLIDRLFFPFYELEAILNELTQSSLDFSSSAIMVERSNQKSEKEYEKKCF